ncbi:hypothetical protein SCULI_v1c08350 [Spiroplasma culicicola AES-1]|uniref:Uncharacterized protein n=2 Tax=Spiroplasma culicicola TaxID=216935 RepID=W6A8G0_9MOLU|nr:hypothetical protein SCULI_v1c08350 [Spiroplasma culicicola AES-1]
MVNFKLTSQILFWLLVVVWIIFLSFYNIAFISNIMISDIENGIQSLEIRKGVNFKWLLPLKLIALKLISTICVSIMLISLVILTSIFKPINQSLWFNSLIPGMCSLFIYDLLITGFIILIGSFNKPKLLIGLSSFFATLFIFSPVTGAVTFILTNDTYGTSSERIAHLKDLDTIVKDEKNSSGLMMYLLQNIQELNDLNKIVDITEKAANESSRPQGSLSFEEIENVIKLGTSKNTSFMQFFLNVGLGLDFDIYLNNSVTFNWNTKFTISDEAKDLKSIWFFKSTIKDNSIGIRQDNYFISENNKNIIGKNQLIDYMKWLESDTTIEKINKDLKIITNTNELKSINKLIKNYYLYYFSQKDYYNSQFENLYMLFGKNTFDTKADRTVEETIYESLKVNNGQRLWITILFSIINDFYQAPIGSGDEIYEQIQNNDLKYMKHYLINPFTSFLYMSLFSGVNSSFSQDLYMNEFFITEAPDIRSAKILENPLASQNTEQYTSFEQRPIIGVELSKRVINTAYIYLIYTLISVILLTGGYFIYIKKIKE